MHGPESQGSSAFVYDPTHFVTNSYPFFGLEVALKLLYSIQSGLV